MIYIKRDPQLIPEKVLAVAQRAQQALEAMPGAQRPDYIKKKSHIWRGFSKYLSKMSYGKCWYSESHDPQAFFDVDHFRPKLEAKRSEDLVDHEGYQWLAFDWDNFRLSAQRSNRLSKDEDNEETVGKGSWFPLLDGSPHACWDNRCIAEEHPILLDPVKAGDLNNVDIAQDGRFVPVPFCVGVEAERVKKSAEIYGLNLPKIKEARQKIIREVTSIHENIMNTAAALGGLGAAAPDSPILGQIDLLKSKTRADAPFSKAARAQLSRLAYGDAFIDRTFDTA